MHNIFQERAEAKWKSWMVVDQVEPTMLTASPPPMKVVFSVI